MRIGQMLKRSVVLSLPPTSPLSLKANTSPRRVSILFASKVPKVGSQLRALRCAARRRVIRHDEEEDGAEGYGHNEDIAILESYSQSAKGEALLVHAVVDEEEVEVLIFKGFSSCLSGRTSPDPSRSVLPAGAVIKSIDRIKGPFDPSNTEYIQEGLTWEAFKSTLLTS